MATITLLSDFGLQDASVAIAKGVLMQHVTETCMVDISHEVAPFQSRQAAYLLSATYRNFSEGTCHLLLFDIFASATPRLILSMYKGHYFLSADNDLVTTAISDIPDASWLCFELKKEHTFADWLTAAGRTIQQLQTKTPAQLGYPQHLYTGAATREIMPGIKMIDCEVIHIDRYENVILNITRQRFDELSAGRAFRLQLMYIEDITELSNNYNDVKEGYKLCRFNSNDYLEVCVNRGKAASLFGFRVNSDHNKVKLFFE